MNILAFLLVIAPICNLYFVWHGWHTWRADPGHSAILFSIFVAKVLVWATGMVIGVLAARYLLDLPVLGYDGVLVALALIAINLVPAILHLAIVQYERL